MSAVSKELLRRRMIRGVSMLALVAPVALLAACAAEPPPPPAPVQVAPPAPAPVYVPRARG